MWSPFLHYISYNCTAISPGLLAVPLYVSVCMCVCNPNSLFYPQLREADRSRRSSSMGLAGPVVRYAAPPLPEESRLETVALSEYSGMTSNWLPSSPSSSVCVSSSSLSTSCQGENSVSGKCRYICKLRSFKKNIEKKATLDFMKNTHSWAADKLNHFN